MRASFEGSRRGPRRARARRTRRCAAPAALAERAERRRAPRGPAEGALLRALLARRGRRRVARRVVGAEGGVDVLVTRAVEGAVPLSEAPARSPPPPRD